jgi:hypothetical protein
MLTVRQHPAHLSSGVALVHNPEEEDPTPRPGLLIKFSKYTGWITKSTDMFLPSVDLCWIPQARRGDEYAVHGSSKIIIGAEQGAITIIDLSPVLKT